VKRATRLVQQLLTMARLDPDAARPATAFDLATVAASVVEEKTPFAEQQRLSLALAAAPVQLCGQEDALRILLANLVDNALRYTPPADRSRCASDRMRPGAHRGRGQRSRHPEEERERCSIASIEAGRRQAAAADWTGHRAAGRHAARRFDCTGQKPVWRTSCKCSLPGHASPQWARAAIA